MKLLRNPDVRIFLLLLAGLAATAFALGYLSGTRDTADLEQSVDEFIQTDTYESIYTAIAAAQRYRNTQSENPSLDYGFSPCWPTTSTQIFLHSGQSDHIRTRDEKSLLTRADLEISFQTIGDRFEIVAELASGEDVQPILERFDALVESVQHPDTPYPALAFTISPETPVLQPLSN